MRYIHTNLIAKDWRALADFYCAVFGCTPVPPERRFSGPLLEAGTGIAGAVLEGVHLALPGYPAGGPTLEIFSYSPSVGSELAAANRPGFTHIAFSVASVEHAREEVFRHGATALGEIVTVSLADGRRVKWCYTRDPEGNIVELQQVFMPATNAG